MAGTRFNLFSIPKCLGMHMCINVEYSVWYGLLIVCSRGVIVERERVYKICVLTYKRDNIGYAFQLRNIAFSSLIFYTINIVYYLLIFFK